MHTEDHQLMHFGIKGQQWGIRRFQRNDGTLTPEGVERYQKNSSSGKLFKSPIRKEDPPNKQVKLPGTKDGPVNKQTKPPFAKEGPLGKGGADSRFQNGKSHLKMKGIDKKAHPDWKSSDAANLSDEELNRRNNRLQKEQQYKNLTTPQWKKTLKESAKTVLLTTTVTALSAALAATYKKNVGPFIVKNAKKAFSAIKSADIPSKIHDLVSNVKQ